MKNKRVQPGGKHWISQFLCYQSNQYANDRIAQIIASKILKLGKRIRTVFLIGFQSHSITVFIQCLLA